MDGYIPNGCPYCDRNVGTNVPGTSWLIKHDEETEIEEDEVAVVLEVMLEDVGEELGKAVFLRL